MAAAVPVNDDGIQGGARLFRSPMGDVVIDIRTPTYAFKCSDTICPERRYTNFALQNFVRTGQGA